jgi:hypothetical protein
MSEETQRQENRADVRRILRYVRAADRIREITTATPLVSTIEWDPFVRLYSATGGLLIRASGYKVREMTDWVIVENLLAKMRPLYHDGENCSFRKIVKILPKHVRISGDISCEELEKKWDAILSSSEVTIPEGTRIGRALPGYDAVATKPGSMQIGFDSQPLTAREAIDLCLYGELVHLDQNKERKRLRIQKSELSDAFKMMVIAIVAQLLETIDHLRLYAQRFLDHFTPEKLEEIEQNVA